MSPDRCDLRRTFDRAAADYEAARPAYPEELIDALVDATGIMGHARLLEVGCGPGTATVPLAERGYDITALELGPNLAEVARANLEPFPRVNVVCDSFEDWVSQGAAFDLILAATSWPWVDPAVRYRRAHELLGPGGHLAVWGAAHVLPEDGDHFFVDIQEVYDEIGEGLPAGARLPAPGQLPDLSAEIAASGLFEVELVRHFDWLVRYDADSYLRLLDTFSGHLAMAPDKRDHLYSEIRRRLSARPDGLLDRHWGAVLHVARRSRRTEHSSAT
jgi:SAM-dependent methyltransferase